MGVSAKFMAARKKHVADRLASDIYALVLEEEMSNGNVVLPAGVKRDVFYMDKGVAKEALTQCVWIGSGAGQVDELKESQAAILRVASGLSTYEIECARLGQDWRDMFAQRQREDEDIKKRGLDFDLTAKKPLGHEPAPTDITDDGNPDSNQMAPTGAQ